MPMPPDPHTATQASFRAALWVPETPPALGPEPTVARRFSVYRNNVQSGLSRALATRFPTVERLVGAEFFAAMARVFAAKHPPSSPVLLDWGGDFAEFLAGFPPVATLPYLPDVARLEWLRGRAYHAADHRPIDLDALRWGDPAGLVLRLAPCCARFTSPHPAVTIWALNQPGQTPRPVPPGPERALIARAPDLSVLVEPLKASDSAILAALMRGAPLGKAAEHGDPAPVLTLLIRHALITAIERPAP